MKKINSRILVMCFLMALAFRASITFAAPQADSITITVYADCRDWSKLKATAGSPDSSANAHNLTQFTSYDPSILYITGHWSKETAAGKGDWTFIPMDSIAPNIFKATFKYGKGYFKGNTADDPDLTENHVGWYFAPTNDWSTAEWVPAPCNVAWDIQRIFSIDVNKPDTTVVFKYGVCQAQTLCSLGIPSLCKTTEINSQFSNGVSFFPNPASDMVHINNSSNIKSVIINDITGKIVKTVLVNGNQEVSFSIKSLPSSLYIMKISYTNGATATAKLMKR